MKIGKALWELVPKLFGSLDPVFIDGLQQMILSAMIVMTLIRWVGYLPRRRAIVYSRWIYHHTVLFCKLGIAMFEESFLTWKLVICYSLLPMWYVVSFTIGLGTWNFSANGTEGCHKKVGHRLKQQPVQTTKKYGLSRIFSNLLKLGKFVQHSRDCREGESLGDKVKQARVKYESRTEEDLRKILNEIERTFTPQVYFQVLDRLKFL